MALLVVGSIAFDSVETPAGAAEDVLGGSAVYFSLAASFMTDVRLVGVVGEDFKEEYLDVLCSRNIDVRGLERKEGKTFRWKGNYCKDINVAETIAVELNVFDNYTPVVPEDFKNTEYVFLANGSPVSQIEVIEQLKAPKLVVADTMNHWITGQRQELEKLLKRIDGLVLNDGEARLLTGQSNLIRAAQSLLDKGPKFVVIKKGEHGAFLAEDGKVFAIPAYPTERVVDPTGAGDSFAGGMMGYIAQNDDAELRQLRRAIVYGTVLASINIEDFSLNRFNEVTLEEINERFKKFQDIVKF